MVSFIGFLSIIQPKFDNNYKIGRFCCRKKSILIPTSVKEASEVYAKLHSDEHINDKVFSDYGYHQYLQATRQKTI